MVCAGSAGHKVSETAGTQQKIENIFRGVVSEAIVIGKAPKVPSTHPLTLPTYLSSIMAQICKTARLSKQNSDDEFSP